MPVLRQLGKEGLPDRFGDFWYGSPKILSGKEQAKRLIGMPSEEILKNIDVLRPDLEEQEFELEYLDDRHMSRAISIAANLAIGPLLSRPNENPHNPDYQCKGRVVLCQSQSGEWFFSAVLHFGRDISTNSSRATMKTLYSGYSLQEAIEKINNRTARLINEDGFGPEDDRPVELDPTGAKEALVGVLVDSTRGEEEEKVERSISAQAKKRIEEIEAREARRKEQRRLQDKAQNQ